MYHVLDIFKFPLRIVHEFFDSSILGQICTDYFREREKERALDSTRSLILFKIKSCRATFRRPAKSRRQHWRNDVAHLTGREFHGTPDPINLRFAHRDSTRLSSRFEKTDNTDLANDVPRLSSFFYDRATYNALNIPLISVRFHRFVEPVFLLCHNEKSATTVLLNHHRKNIREKTEHVCAWRIRREARIERRERKKDRSSDRLRSRERFTQWIGMDRAPAACRGITTVKLI